MLYIYCNLKTLPFFTFYQPSSDGFQRGFNDFYSAKHRHQRRNYHLRQHQNSSSLTSNEGVRLLPPPENERYEGENGGEQKRESHDDENTCRSTMLQSRLESLKSAASIDVGTKQSIARRRWFDAFDHVCRQVNEVTLIIISGNINFVPISTDFSNVQEIYFALLADL